MTRNADKLWDKLAPRLRRFEGIDLTPAELESEADGIEHIDSLSAADIESIVSMVIGDKEVDSSTPQLSWHPEMDITSVEDGILQLNRNRGDHDEHVEEKLNELRRRELEKEDNELGEDDLETE